jgi:hypothetical protein
LLNAVCNGPLPTQDGPESMMKRPIAKREFKNSRIQGVKQNQQSRAELRVAPFLNS